MAPLLAAIALTFRFRTVEWNGVIHIRLIKMEMANDVGGKSKSTLTIKPIVLSYLPVFTSIPTGTLHSNDELQNCHLPRTYFERLSFGGLRKRCSRECIFRTVG